MVKAAPKLCSFASVEKAGRVPNRRFATEIAQLRARLLDAQFALREAGVPVVIIVSGVDGAGKGQLVQRLNEWLDPRGVDTHAFRAKTADEKEHPRYWRYWRALPGRGRVAILFGSWYTGPILQRVYGEISKSGLREHQERIVFHERMLQADGMLCIKFWLHLSRKDQRKRLKDLAADPLGHWRVLPEDWEHHARYEDFLKTSGRVLAATHQPGALWRIIGARDSNHRDLTVARQLAEALESRAGKPAAKPKPAASVRRPAAPNVLAGVDLKQALSEDTYQRRLKKYLARLNRLAWAAEEQGRAAVLVFEGWDAAGKGSAIRRVTAALDPRLYRVVPVAAPTDEEKAHHYLWRFWRQLPRDGQMTIFDRSWYGRVLVERIEGYATAAEWQRAYDEINDFEAQLIEHEVIVAKFWIHISAGEQMRRFQQRETTPHKRHKITDEDWRNRAKWSQYETAVNDMVARTGTRDCPWHLIPGNQKRFARIEVLKTLCGVFEQAL